MKDLKLSVGDLPVLELKGKIAAAGAQLCSSGHMTGWLTLPSDYDKDEFERIKRTVSKIRANSEVFIVIGIGGSYLGARAVIEALKPNFYNNLSKAERTSPEIYFAGQNVNGSYLSDLIKVIGDKDFSINVISKSGTTTEPAISFRIFRNILEKKYGKEGAKERIFVTTDRENGALKKMSERLRNICHTQQYWRTIFCLLCSWSITNRCCRHRHRSVDGRCCIGTS